METRRIIAFGNSSYVISVPKSWITENKLKKGDIVQIDEKKDELTISPGQTTHEKEVKRAVIDFKDDEQLPYVKSKIISAYLNNYDLIEIRGRFKEGAPRIKAILRNLTGMEIIQQSSEKVVAKDLLNIREISIDILIRRIDNLIRSVILDSMVSLKQNNYHNLLEMDKEVNRLVYLTYRVIRAAMLDSKLAKKIYRNNVMLLYEWSLVTRLEKIGDQSKRIARYIKEANFTESDMEKFESLFDTVKESYLEVMKSYYKKDIESALKWELESSVLTKKCSDFVKANHNVAMHKAIENLKNMTVSIKNVARAVIGMENSQEENVT